MAEEESDEYSLAPQEKPEPGETKKPKPSAFDAAPVRQRPEPEKEIPPGASDYVGEPPTPAEQNQAKIIHLLGVVTFLGPLIYMKQHKVLGWIVGVFLTFTTCLGGPFLTAVGAASIISSIIAAIKVGEGIAYRYPYSIRLIK